MLLIAFFEQQELVTFPMEASLFFSAPARKHCADIIQEQVFIANPDFQNVSK